MKNLYLASFIIALVGCESVPNAIPCENGRVKKDLPSKTIVASDLYVRPDVKAKHAKIWGVPSQPSSSVSSDAKNKPWKPKDDSMAYYYAEKQKFPMPEEKSLKSK
jgi:starvation-inducible outer membrane lipoprotein